MSNMMLILAGAAIYFTLFVRPAEAALLPGEISEPVYPTTYEPWALPQPQRKWSIEYTKPGPGGFTISLGG